MANPAHDLSQGSAIRSLTEAQQRVLFKLRSNYPGYAKKLLRIKTKEGRIAPFVFNQAQTFIHQRLEAQKQRIGRVRALVLKGRQQGCSTYVGGRFFHKTSSFRGQSTFILSHESQTTQKLFQMVDRFYENLDEPLRPRLKASNRKQLIFEGLESEYTVGTAGNENVGRGGTLQNFHGSEVAFWEKTAGLRTGVLQAVADLPGTEIILESTARGMGDMFYEMCMDAIDGRGDYELIFTPWYWQTEYRRPVPPDFCLTDEEVEYKRIYRLDDEQMFWRRMKIENDLKSDWEFKREYPANPQEAFTTSGDCLVSSERIMAARSANVTDRDAPLIMGVDPAREGDRTVISFRRGRCWDRYLVYQKMDEMLLAGIIAAHIRSNDVAKVFVDVGLGYGTVDRLRELGYHREVTGVHFGEKAIESDIYSNKRAEMALNFRDWIHGGGVSIPDEDEVHKDINIVPDFVRTSNGKIKLVAKEKIKEEYGMSPDIFDSIILTFAFPVANTRAQAVLNQGSAVRNSTKNRGLRSMRHYHRNKDREDNEAKTYSININRE